jgi:hypothetical protein
MSAAENREGASAAIDLVARTQQWDPESLDAAPLDAPSFRKWRFWQVRTQTFPPASTFVATHGERAALLPLEEGLAPVVTVEPLAIASLEAAVEHVRFFLGITMPLATVLDSVEDVPGLRAEARALWADHVQPPAAHAAGEGFLVYLWLCERGALLRGAFHVERNGKIGVQLERVAEKVAIHIPML